MQLTPNSTVMSSTTMVAGILDLIGTTDASDASGDTGILRVEGGASIAKKLYVGTDLDVDGTANLDIVDIDGAVTINADVSIADGKLGVNSAVHADSQFFVYKSSGDEGDNVIRCNAGSGSYAGTALEVQIARQSGESNYYLAKMISKHDNASPATRFSVRGDGLATIDGSLTVPLIGAGIAASSSHAILAHRTDNTQVFRMEGSNASLATEIGNIVATRAASDAYYFLKMHSNNNADAEFTFRGDGQAYADGAWNGGGADYAEYFEWKDGNSSTEDRRGYSVVLDGNKIVKAADGETPIGVISARPAVIGDTDIGKWKGKYLTSDFGDYIMETYTVTTWTVDGEEVWYESDKIPAGVTTPADAVVTTQDSDNNTFIRRKLNPDYNSDTAYVSREDRKEWDAVGLMGKLRLRKGQPTAAGWIKMRDVSDTVEEWLIR